MRHPDFRFCASLLVGSLVVFLGGTSRADNWVATGNDGGGIRTTSGNSKVGIGIANGGAIQNRLDVKGGVAIGTYAGVTPAAPTNGMIISGNVGIGTATVGSDKLTVNGNIKATSVTADGGIKVKTWSMEVPDYVFDDGHRTLTLAEVEAFVKANRHLPEVPSATAMKKQGMDLVEMNLILLKKVEELTLYVIDQDKKIAKLSAASGAATK